MIYGGENSISARVEKENGMGKNHEHDKYAPYNIKTEYARRSVCHITTIANLSYRYIYFCLFLITFYRKLYLFFAYDGYSNYSHARICTALWYTIRFLMKSTEHIIVYEPEGHGSALSRTGDEWKEGYDAYRLAHEVTASGYMGIAEELVRQARVRGIPLHRINDMDVD